MTDEKWVNVEDYLGKGALDQQKDRMSEAQEGVTLDGNTTARAGAHA